jgi:hypothetical protein
VENLVRSPFVPPLFALSPSECEINQRCRRSKRKWEGFSAIYIAAQDAAPAERTAGEGYRVIRTAACFSTRRKAYGHHSQMRRVQEADRREANHGRSQWDPRYGRVLQDPRRTHQKVQACSNRMKKSDSAKLDTIIAMLGDIVDVFGKRFDKLEERMTTKQQRVALHTQVNSIEQQHREGRYEVRLGNLETKVFGAPRR